MTYPNFFHLNCFCQLSYPSSISLAKVEKKKIRSNAWVEFLASFTFCPNTDITDLIILQEWTDSNMRWNTTEYNNVKDIRVPPANLWKPDILMYNRFSKTFVLK